MSMAAEMATGVPKPAAPSIAGQAGDGLLDHLELPRLDGDVVDEDGVEDDPADGQEAEGRAVEGGGRGGGGRHAVDADGDAPGQDQAQDGGPVGLDVEEGQRAEQRHHGDGGDQRGDQQVADGDVVLCPGQRVHRWAPGE
jgi:hypothetical protein